MPERVPSALDPLWTAIGGLATLLGGGAAFRVALAKLATRYIFVTVEELAGLRADIARVREERDALDAKHARLRFFTQELLIRWKVIAEKLGDDEYNPVMED